MQNFSVKLVLKSQTVNQKLVEIIREIGEFEVLSDRATRRPDLLIFELGGDTAKEMTMIESLLQGDEVGEVFLTAAIAEPAVLMQAIRIGVREFFSQPIKAEEIRQALYKFKERRKGPEFTAESKNGEVISVFGSKGGVGTTTVAVNLAVSLLQVKSGRSVVLMDMNTLFGEIPLFLEISPKFHWGEITKNIDRLDNTFLMNILARHETGVHVLPSPAYLNGHVRPTPDIMSRLIDLMKSMFDYVIVDAGQSTDDTSLRVFEMSNNLLLVTILSLPCLANASRLIRSFSDLGYLTKDRIKIVLNRYLKNNEISLRDAEAGIQHELFWVIPNDYNTTMSAINRGRSLPQIASRAGITKNFAEFAMTLTMPEVWHEKKKRGIFKRRF